MDLIEKPHFLGEETRIPKGKNGSFQEEHDQYSHFYFVFLIQLDITVLGCCVFIFT